MGALQGLPRDDGRRRRLLDFPFDCPASVASHQLYDHDMNVRALSSLCICFVWMAFGALADGRART